MYIRTDNNNNIVEVISVGVKPVKFCEDNTEEKN